MTIPPQKWPNLVRAPKKKLSPNPYGHGHFAKKTDPNWSFLASVAPFTIYTPPIGGYHRVLDFATQITEKYSTAMCYPASEVVPPPFHPVPAHQRPIHPLFPGGFSPHGPASGPKIKPAPQSCNIIDVKLGPAIELNFAWLTSPAQPRRCFSIYCKKNYRNYHK